MINILSRSQKAKDDERRGADHIVVTSEVTTNQRRFAAMATTTRKRMGRPPKPPEARMIDVGLRLDPGTHATVTAMAVERGIERAAMIRELLAEALAARAKRDKR
jgi:hypothetical protein